MKHQLSTLAVAVSLLGLSGYAQANFTITDGEFTYTQGGPYASSTVLNGAYGTGPDNLFQDNWYYRVSGDTAESALSPVIAPTSTTTDRAVLNYDIVFGTIAAQLDYSITDLGSGEVSVKEVMTITNSGTKALTIDLFYYVDLDVAGTSNGDSAVLAEPNRILFTDSGYAFSAIGANADAYQVTPYNSLRTSLEDSGITNLNNTGAPLSNIDATTAFQWSLTIDAGSSASVTGYIGIGDYTEAEAVAATTDVPEPESNLAMLFTGLMAVVGLRRRRRSAQPAA